VSMLNGPSRSPRTRPGDRPRTRRFWALAAIAAMLLAGTAHAAPGDRTPLPRCASGAPPCTAATPQIGIADVAASETSLAAHLAPGAGRKEVREFAECFIVGMGLGRVLALFLGGVPGAILAIAAAARCV